MKCIVIALLVVMGAPLMFKQADFTVVTEYGGRPVLANCLCGTLDAIDSGLIDDRYLISVGMLDKHELSYLAKRGHLQARDNEQRESINRLWGTYLKEHETTCYVYLQLTHECNLRCSYCFQASNGYQCCSMTLDSLRKIELRLMRLLKLPFNPSQVVVVLYGGEPLLAKNMNLVTEAIDICGRHGFRLRIITNGIQLPRYLTTLERGNGVLDGVTVTLDGDRVAHDDVRRNPDGRGTYDRVVSSIETAMLNGIDVSVRLNVSQNNIDMLRRPYWRHSGFKYEIHRVEYPSYEKAVSFWQLLELCLDGYISLSELAVNQVSYFYQIFEEDQAHYPLFGDCFSGSVLLFSPEGAVYDCNEAGFDSVAIGDAGDDSCSYFESTGRLLGGRAVLMEGPCSKCPVYPVCGGACRVRRAACSTHEKCPYFTDISDMLRRYVSWKTELQEGTDV